MNGDNAHKLLGILQSHAPNVAARQKCSDVYKEMFDDGLTSSEVERNMAGILHDGLRHGNWPWNNNPVIVQEN